MASISLTPGQVFARDYTIVRELSEGGMGVVYIAAQASTGKRRALKVMQPQLVSARDPRVAYKHQQRFLNEARVGASIQSEHVVEVLAAGVDEGTGAPWLVMELLEGNDLADELSRRTRLPCEEVQALFMQLCHALGAAHRAGVCHLDLKPENVFLARSNNARGGITLKVLDFGIARMVSDHQRSVTMTTAQGSMYWMSLEQSKGAHVGPYSDVWSLGLLAFKLLTGLHYWRTANQSEGATLHAWILEVAQGDYATASQRAKELGVERYVPAGFDEWFAHCVCIDVNARWANADTAFRVLSAILQPTPQPTPQPTSQPTPQPTLQATPQPIFQPTPDEAASTQPSLQPASESLAPTQIASAPIAPTDPEFESEPAPETSALKLMVLGAAGMSGLLLVGLGVWRLLA